MLAALRGVAVGLVGVVGGLAVAIVLSGFMSFGIADIVEPDAGINANWSVLLIAAAAVMLLTVATSVIGGARARRAASTPGRTHVLRVGAATNVPAGVGVRFACTGLSLLGRGVAGPSIGIAALVGALVFGASLAHLRSDSELYGWPWDVSATNYGAPPPGTIDPGSPEGIAALQARPEFEAAAVGTTVPVSADGHEFTVLTLDVAKGSPQSALPPIVEGRAPQTATEIALGSNTLDDLGKDVGDTAKIRIDEVDVELDVTIVGRVVLPLVFAIDQPGNGGLMPNRALLDKTPLVTGVGEGTDIVAGDSVYVRTASGVSDQEALRALNEVAGGTASLFPYPRVEPSELVDFGRVDAFPLIAGGVLALLAASTLLHVLVSSVTARRKDMAALRAFGMRRNDVRRVVGAQAGFLAGVALLLGVPIGVLVGRTLWTLYAERSGFISVVEVPALALLVVGVLTLVIAELCAAIPAQFAARVRPAVTLRSE
jgi:hypothetical protein